MIHEPRCGQGSAITFKNLGQGNTHTKG